jgi:nucleoside-diphosphate-sugar epimerase
VLHASTAPAAGIVNVASGVETSIVELARIALRCAGRSPEEVDVSQSPTARAVVDISRSKDLWGMSPAWPLAEGIAQLIATRRARAAP